ncbi:MAG TPA: class I SAM-dependent rRNA methyltransferase [Cyclobacteriaceae bacterium]|nr:class I SAM-dependent rRNA methyltransferase [Cyclobacteriaceae bacterium]
MFSIDAAVRLAKGKEYSVGRFHPWIFSGAIKTIEGGPKDGQWVKVFDSKNNVLGYGHFQKGSIAVRMLSFEKELPADSFWTGKISGALSQRRATNLPNENTSAYRLVHGEGDGLPGLIIDFYDGVAIVQAHSSGMHMDRMAIAEALREVMNESLQAIFYKSHGTLPGNIRSQVDAEYLFGMSAVPHIILEHGNRFLVDWEGGQKTGFFLDQRENRMLLSKYSPGRIVLNTFCYTGGFSVYALRGGALRVHSVDASEKAIELTKRNIELNGFDPFTNYSYAADTFEFLKDKHDVYDLIVLDPPAFAKHREARHQAVKGYQRLNAEALRVIKSGGIIFTFSCSQVVDKQLFYDTVVSSAIQSKRKVKVLEHLSQPSDHPVSIFHPEGEYLKGLVLYVE